MLCLEELNEIFYYNKAIPIRYQNDLPMFLKECCGVPSLPAKYHVPYSGGFRSLNSQLSLETLFKAASTSPCKEPSQYKPF
jgi:hypothetical protein